MVVRITPIMSLIMTIKRSFVPVLMLARCASKQRVYGTKRESCGRLKRLARAVMLTGGAWKRRHRRASPLKSRDRRGRRSRGC